MDRVIRPFIKNFVEYLLGFLKEQEICDFLQEFLESQGLSMPNGNMAMQM